MALSCDIKEQIFSFQGKEYNYNQFLALMHSGLMEAVESGKAFLSEGKGVADNVVDVSSAEAIDALLDQSTGSNAFGINKAKIIGQAIRALNSLVSSGYGYDAKTGGGVRVFIAKTNADYVAATEKARGKAHKGRGIFVDRIGKDGKKEGYDIYINLEAASALTVSHEVMHFYLVNAFGENPELFKSFAGSMSNLLRASDVQYLANFVKEYDESQAPEEYVVEMGAIITNRIARGNVTPKEQGLFAKIADLVNSTIYKITKGRLGYSIDTTSKTAVQEFFEGLAGAIADGKSFDQTLAEAAKEEVTQQKKKDAVQEPTTAEVGAQPSRTEGVREEGGGGVRPGVEGTQATQAGGAQAEVASAASLPQEIQSLDDNQVVTLTYQSLDDVPEVLRTKAKSVKGADTEITTRKSILGIPIGKETKIKTPAKEYYVVVASGAEIKQAAQEQLAMNQPTAPITEAAAPKSKEARIISLGEKAKYRTEESSDPSAVPLYIKIDEQGNDVLKDGEKTYLSLGYKLIDSDFLSSYTGPVEDTSKPNYDNLHYEVTAPARQKLNELIDNGSIDYVANRLVEITEEMLKDPAVAAGRGWYSRMRDAIKKIFNDPNDVELFTHLLGATSAQTPVETNMEYSVDIFERYKNGEFDNQIKKFLEIVRLVESNKLLEKSIELGITSNEEAYTTSKDKKGNEITKRTITDSKLIRAWIDKYNLLPRQKNGSLYNANSLAVLKALSGVWMMDKGSPKTPQFSMNLSGISLQATIDVWAARTLSRIIYGRPGESNWRIQPKNETGVSEADFVLGQEVFKRAAEKLGMNPDDLQAIVWFGEKEVWEKNGWTGEIGAFKSSFDEAFEVFFPTGKKPRGADVGRNIMLYIREERKVKADLETKSEFEKLYDIKDKSDAQKQEYARERTSRKKHYKDYEESIQRKGVKDFIREEGRGIVPSSLQGINERKLSKGSKGDRGGIQVSGRKREGKGQIVKSKAQEIPAVLSNQDPLTHPLDGLLDKEGVSLAVLSTPEQKEKYSEQVWNLYEESYREIGLPITKDQWPKELEEHVAHIVIEGGEPVAFSMTKPSKFGNKMTAVGSFQNEKDKGYAKMMLVSLMNRPGFYAELSKAARAIALKNDVPIVKPRFAKEILAGKNPRPVNNIDYVREIGSVGEQNKTIFGKPWKTQEKKESYPSVMLTEESKKKYLTEHKAGKSIPTLWPTQRVSGLTDSSLMTLMSGRTKSEQQVKSKAQEIPSTIVVDGKTVSTVNNEGTQIFDNEQGIKNFWKWYSESNQLEDGKPIVWMHGTAARFEEFEPKQARAIFLTREENFADHFSDLSFNWMVGHPDKFLTKEALLDAYDNAIKYAKELNSAYSKHERLRAKANKVAKQIKQEYGKIDADVKDSAIHSEYYSLIEKMNALSDKALMAENIDVSEKDGYEYAVKQINQAKENTLNNLSPRILPEVFTEYIKDSVGAQKTVLRLYANTKNPFDYQNPQHVEALINNMKELKDVDESEYISIKLGNGNVFGHTKREYINMVKRGSWPAIESPQAQEAIIKLKHDGFYVAEGGEKNLAVYSSNQLKSVTDNNGDFGLDIPRFREQKFPTEGQINQQANEENKEFLTVVRRRLVKLGIDGRDADAQVLRDRNTLVDPTEFEAARKAAGDLFAMTIFDPAVSSLPPVEVAKLLADKMETIGNLPSRIYFAGNVHSYIDDMVTSKKIGKRLREQLRDISDDVVVRMAQMGREYGQASAMFARVYADFKKFDFLVNVKKMQLDTQAGLNSKTTEDGTTVKDAIEEVREETEKILETTPELKELIELAAEVNDINLKDHGDKVAQGDIRGTSDPVMYTAEQFIEQQNKFNDAISDLQDKVTDLEAKLKKATDQYIKEQGKNAKLTKEISDLRDQIVNLNALIDKLRDSNKKLSADKSRYKSQLDALRNKFANLKALLKILKANKNISKQREEKMMAALVDMIAGGRLNDPDFDSVFAEVFNIGYMTSKDKAALESLANGLKYLSENPNSEISQIYIKRFNDYLESVSTEPWNAYRVATLLQGAFYHSVLSGVSTFFNATYGSMFTAMPNAAAYSFANILFNPKTALGSIVYGMKRMIEETKTAVSKGVFNQRAYDNMGTSWSGENLTDRADLAEVHLVNGFLNNLDKYRRSTTGVAKLKNGLAVVGSLVYQLAHFKRLMMFVDPTVTHMLSSYLQGSIEYRKAAEEMRAMRAAGTAPKEMLDAMATWAPFISPKWMRKIDEHVNYTKNDRADAAKQAQKEIDEMAKHGIKVRPFYLRRRTSEIMRERMGKEMALEIDKVSRDWLMMWRPDGALGYGWERVSKRLAVPQGATGLEAFMKTMLGITAFAFFRITAAGVNIVQSSIPIVGIGLSMYGIRKNFESNSKGKTMWGIGRKYKTESKTALGALKPSSIYKDLKDPKDFESFRVVTRLGISTMSTLTMALVMMNMFEFWDDEEEEGAEYVDIPLIGRARLDPDRWIDITASGTGAGSKDQGMQEGRTSFAVRFRLGKDAEWSRWMSTRLWPHMIVPVALIGRMADDAKGVYYDPKQSKKTAKPAEGIVEYAGEIPLALGEMSFNTIGRAYSQSKYDPTGALTKFVLSPWYAVAQPRLANDLIVSANDALDLPKKDIYTGQGAKDVLKNMTYSLYGIDRFLSDDATDQFGIPLKSINPVTNWWTYVSDESLRSKEHPEWNLVYRYQNTNMPSQRGFIIEKVERTDKDGYLIDSEKKKYMSEYEKYVELNSDERKLAIQGVKTLFRNQILLMYENLPNFASEYKGSDYIDEGEIVSEKLEQTLSWAKEEMSNTMISIANEKDPNKKQLLMEGVFKEMQKMNKESDEIVREILSSGKLPKTGLGRDAKKMAPIL